MKHFIAIGLLISSFFPVLADQHEKIINEISEINDVFIESTSLESLRLLFIKSVHCPGNRYGLIHTRALIFVQVGEITRQLDP